MTSNTYSPAWSWEKLRSWGCFGSGRSFSSGKVVKVTRGVMGKNWIHLQDGSAGGGGENDLVVTTDAVLEVGNTVLVHGAVSVDRDLGFGYRYEVMVENAECTPE